jgi:acetyl esterase/lipase
MKPSLAENLSIPGLLLRLASANLRAFAGSEEQIPYGDHPQQYSLLVLPPPGAPQRRTLIFFVHGGGWRMGSPTLFRAIGRWFAQRGYPTLLAGYRLVPHFRFPTQVEDTCAAYRAGIEAAAVRGLAADRVLLGGQSAGAQLVSLMALHQGWAERAGLERRQLAGIFLVSGPLDLSAPVGPEAQHLLANFLGDMKLRDQADPMRCLTGPTAAQAAIVPTLCLHGELDPLVPLEQSLNFVTRLRQNGAPASGPRAAELVVLPGKHHSELGELFLIESPPARRLLDWIENLDSCG